MPPGENAAERSAGSDAQALSEQVAWACRILAMQGYEDLTLGHASALAADGHTVYIKRKGVSLSEVTPDDVLAVDLDVFDRAFTGAHLETVLHTEVYRRRADVRCVVHGHPPFATAFGATDAHLEFLTHDSVLFVDGVATYDDVPNLITDAEQGGRVAEALGAGSVLLLRNHGVLVAQRDVQWAVLTAVLLERAVQLQAIARSLGQLRPIPDECIAQIHADKYQQPFAAEYWNAWIRELRRSGRAFGMPQEDAWTSS